MSLITLAAVLRVLNRLEWFDGLDPIGTGSTPIELLRLREDMPAHRQRVSRKALKVQRKRHAVQHRQPKQEE
ncbi:hypothetical protein [Bifidobacterium sp.]|uniref:hypothetical protein n=1 Tax=Bifidobacterium sp. TaxID=41200 RepID=UPI0025BCEDBD|nr:hypothetical protein [Bifidobacterium sp.]MCI1635306.1 hypothetical protein [Bifidobacterium sp.]